MTVGGSVSLRSREPVRSDSSRRLPDSAGDVGPERGRHIGPLTDAQWRAVGEMILTHSRPRVRTRAAAILLSAQGLTVRQIADLLRVRLQSVRKWFDWFEAEGEVGLLDERRLGASARAGPAFIRRLRQTAAVRPATLGYTFESWNAVRLRNHLVKVTGVQIGEERVRQLLRAAGLSFRRPATATLPASVPAHTPGRPRNKSRPAPRTRG